MKSYMQAPKVAAYLRGGPADGTRITLSAVDADSGLPMPSYVVPVPIDAHKPTGQARYLLDLRNSAPITYYTPDPASGDKGAPALITSVLTYSHDKEFIQ